MHTDILEQLREQDNPELMQENTAEKASDHHKDPCQQGPEGSVKLMEKDDNAMHFSDPISYAKYLCDNAGLTREQRGPVVLRSRDMQQVYTMEVERRAQLTEAHRQS